MDGAAMTPPASGSSSADRLERELSNVAGAVEKVEGKIDALDVEIKAGMQAFAAGTPFEGLCDEKLLSYLDNLREEKKQLRKEKEQLREEKAKLMDRQHHGGADGMLQKIYDRILADQRRARTVSISRASQGIWDEVRAKANLEVAPFAGDLGATARDGVIPLYRWDERMESAQATRYMLYVQNLLLDAQKRSFALLDGNSECTLDADGLSDVVGYKFHGRPDAVLVVRSATQMPQAGLRVVFEFKKKVTGRNFYQALVTLLLANWHASRLKPFVILTDLNDAYTFFWLDNHTIYFHEASSAAFAWGLFDAILGSERWSAEEGVVPRDDIETPAAPAKRRRLVLDAAAPDAQLEESDIANLMDLEGFLSTDELRALRMGELLRQLRTIPALEASRKDWEAMFG